MAPDGWCYNLIYRFQGLIWLSGNSWHSGIITEQREDAPVKGTASINTQHHLKERYLSVSSPWSSDVSQSSCWVTSRQTGERKSFSTTATATQGNDIYKETSQGTGYFKPGGRIFKIRTRTDLLFSGSYPCVKWSTGVLMYMTLLHVDQTYSERSPPER